MSMIDAKLKARLIVAVHKAQGSNQRSSIAEEMAKLAHEKALVELADEKQDLHELEMILSEPI